MPIKEFRQRRKNDRHGSQEIWPKIIIEDMQWFPFQVIMLHTVDKIKHT